MKLNPYILSVISGIMCVLSFPPFNLSILIWFALVPFLYSVVKAKSRMVASLCGLIFGAVFYYGSLYWMNNVFPVFGLILVFVLVVFPYIFALILFQFRKYILIMPMLLWVSLEFFRSEIWWLKFSWMSLGYSQHNILPILQFASVYGIYGISALIVFSNSVIVYTLLNRTKKALKVAGSLICFMVLVICFGFVRLDTYTPDISVLLVQDERSDIDIYTGMMSADTDFILLPEYALSTFLDENEVYQKKIIESAGDAYVIVGAKDRAEDDYYNTAYLLNSEGINGRYYKMHPIQFFMDGLPGKEHTVLETEHGRIGIFICYDMDYSSVARKIVRNGAEILFIPTFDAMRWGAVQHLQHSAMTSMRAVENNRFIARAASSGESQIIDPNGRITQNLGVGESGTVIGYVQTVSKQTFYTRIGWLFPIFLILGLIAVFLHSIRRKL